MAMEPVELDFFGMEKPNAPVSRSINRQRSFRDIQSAITKIKPELIKSVLTSGTGAPAQQNLVPSAPIDSRLAVENPPETAPLTIFYNGSVTVFDVPRDKAENIMKLAVAKNSSKLTAESKAAVASTSTGHQQHLLDSLNGDIPLARKMSLHRFLQKRRERLVSATPYGGPPNARF